MDAEGGIWLTERNGALGKLRAAALRYELKLDKNRASADLLGKARDTLPPNVLRSVAEKLDDEAKEASVGRWVAAKRRAQRLR